MGNGVRINLGCSNLNFRLTGAKKGGFSANFDFDFLKFFKILEYSFSYKIFQSLETFYNENYIGTSYLLENSEKNLSGTQISPPRGPKVRAISPYFVFFVKKNKIFFCNCYI